MKSVWIAACGFGLGIVMVLSSAGLVGCIEVHPHDHFDSVDLVDVHGYHHQGYYDDDHVWHGGYYDESHAYHEDAHDWH